MATGPPMSIIQAVIWQIRRLISSHLGSSFVALGRSDEATVEGYTCSSTGIESADFVTTIACRVGLLVTDHAVAHSDSYGTFKADEEHRIAIAIL